MIGPLQGLFYDWAGESFGRVDADEQDWYASFGGPCVCLGRERVVDPDQRVLPGVSCSRKPATALCNQPENLPMLMTMPVVVVHDRFIEMP